MLIRKWVESIENRSKKWLIYYKYLFLCLKAVLAQTVLFLPQRIHFKNRRVRVAVYRAWPVTCCISCEVAIIKIDSKFVFTIGS